MQGGVDYCASNNSTASIAANLLGSGYSEGSTVGRCVELSWSGKIALAYAVESRWRDRSEFVNGRHENVGFLDRPRISKSITDSFAAIPEAIQKTT